MIRIIKTLLIVIFLSSFSFQVNSEWITKKSDKSKSEIKLEKKEKKAELKKKKKLNG